MELQFNGNGFCYANNCEITLSLYKNLNANWPGIIAEPSKRWLLPSAIEKCLPTRKKWFLCGSKIMKTNNIELIWDAITINWNEKWANERIKPTNWTHKNVCSLFSTLHVALIPFGSSVCIVNIKLHSASLLSKRCMRIQALE